MFGGGLFAETTGRGCRVEIFGGIEIFGGLETLGIVVTEEVLTDFDPDPAAIASAGRIASDARNG